MKMLSKKYRTTFIENKSTNYKYTSLSLSRFILNIAAVDEAVHYIVKAALFICLVIRYIFDPFLLKILFWIKISFMNLISYHELQSNNNVNTLIEKAASLYLFWFHHSNKIHDFFFYKQLIFIVRIVRDRALNNWHMSYYLICILNKYNVACDKNQVKKTKLKQLWYMNQPTCTQVPKSNQFVYPSVHLSVWYLLLGAYFSHLPFLATTLLSGCFGVIMCMPIN